MNFLSAANVKLIALSFCLLVITLSPLWFVERCVVQDGSGHVYSSFIMSEILKDNTFFTDFYDLNSPFVPNSSGHWLIALLLQFFSPFVVTKLMLSLTFVVVPASIVWLRRQVSDNGGLITALYMGCAVGFNWLWMTGTFNFILGFACFIFTLGLYWRWRERMNFIRCVALSLLLAVVFFSHLIPFLILAGSIVIVALFAKSETRGRGLLWTAPIVFTALLLFVLYKTQIGSSGEAFSPAWRSLTDPYSLRSWISQLIAVDPFVLISRKTLPFTSFDSTLLAIFSPSLWIIAAFALLLLGTVFSGSGRQIFSRNKLPFLILSAVMMLAALFGPDDFQLMNGGLLRQRLFLIALVFAVPLFQLEHAPRLRRIAHCCLIFVLMFQTAALFEYARKTNAETKDFVEATNAIGDEQTIASAVIIESKPRFQIFAPSQMINYLGIGRNVLVFDNYEMGHNLFPVVTRNPQDREAILRFTQSNVFSLKDANQDIQTKLMDFDFNLANNSGKIDVMLLWGRNDEVEKILAKTFESQPFYESGNIRLFRRIK